MMKENLDGDDRIVGVPGKGLVGVEVVLLEARSRKPLAITLRVGQLLRAQIQRRNLRLRLGLGQKPRDATKTAADFQHPLHRDAAAP